MPTPPQNPAGAFEPLTGLATADLPALRGTLRQVPQRMSAAVRGWTAAQLDLPYRNWTVRQIVHHVADSHLHSYARFKWALTEDRPRIKPYDESAWSQLADARQGAVESSLMILEGLHARWDELLGSLTPDDFERTFEHPETQATVPLWEALGYYAWHGRHHTAQIEWVARERLG